MTEEQKLLARVHDAILDAEDTIIFLPTEQAGELLAAKEAIDAYFKRMDARLGIGTEAAE
jgi:hypothetical protein